MPDTSIVTAAKTVAVGLVTGSAALLGQWLAQRSTSRQAHEARLALVTNADVATQPLRLPRSSTTRP
ncbi:hypothetical protein [Micromonospora sp. IBHARD004]|uniref:hypothetical protein n=1 Tax=Micromonospora sp. IBHARD004 TaxID=3457764 RepID=UPI0040583B01